MKRPRCSALWFIGAVEPPGIGIQGGYIREQYDSGSRSPRLSRASLRKRVPRT